MFYMCPAINLHILEKENIDDYFIQVTILFVVILFILKVYAHNRL